MLARRALAFLIALFAAALVAGCAQTVSGRASFAGGPGGGGQTSAPTSGAETTSASSSSSSSSSSSDTDSSGGDDTNEVCAALDKSKVEQLLGASVTLKESQSSGCQVSASNGKSMIVAVFDFLTLTEYKKGTFQELQVAGHPGVRTDSNILYVARSSDADDEGLLAAYYSGLGSGGDQIAAAMLEQLLTKFAK